MELNLTHLYPDFLNLYGDRGNLAALKKRCEWRGIAAHVNQVQGDELPDLVHTDLLFLGGGSDREQSIVCEKLQKIKDQLQAFAENGGVIVAVCGGYQLLGNFYQLEDQKIPGLSIVDLETTVGKGRLIGNVMIECEIDEYQFQVIGFENHGGRTDIKNCMPLGRVLKGFGNDGESGFEGVMYKNVFGTYLHGPLFPKNPVLADVILTRALKRKYPDFKRLAELDDHFEQVAFDEIKKRMME